MLDLESALRAKTYKSHEDDDFFSRIQFCTSSQDSNNRQKLKKMTMTKIKQGKV